MGIMLIGSDGQLGSALRETLAGEQLRPLTHAEIEVTDPDSLARSFESCRPEIVINTAAFHRVDDCEKQVSKAFAVNCFAVRDLAMACRKFDATLVHFSTDYVFDGEKMAPYREDDLPHPLNVYGASKLAGEHLAAATLTKYFIVRSSGLYRVGGSKSKGGNFVETMLRKARNGEEIRVVDDQVLTPTHTPELARKVKELIRTHYYGIYHITCQGQCSWYEFAGRIFELGGVRAQLRRATSTEFPTLARRPRYSVLENAKLKSLGLDDVKHWEEALGDYFRERNSMEGVAGP